MNEMSSYAIISLENDRDENINLWAIFKKFLERINCSKNVEKENFFEDNLKVTFHITDGKVNSKSKKSLTNEYKSQKYSKLSFFPIVLFNQFRVFYNFYFLLISCAYFFPALNIGVWWTTWIPLIFFLAISFIKEGYGDYQRKVRDDEINDEKYEKLIANGVSMSVKSKDIKPGDIIVVNSNQRVPADMILLGTNVENKGSIFVKTDQLDGETDWKLRKSITSFSHRNWEESSRFHDYILRVEEPRKEVDKFEGVISHGNKIEVLSVNNTLWSSTVVAAGKAVGFVVYSGKHTKCVMNKESLPFKLSLFESEADFFAKMLFAFQLAMSIGLGLSKGFVDRWYLKIIQFVLLLSYILPVSLRVNLDIGKTFYSYMINTDEKIEKTIVRNPNICEEMGRLSFLLTDKTGTLTLNKMNFKKLKIDVRTYSREQIRDICAEKKKLKENKQLAKMMLAISLCHNVTPVTDEKGETVLQGSSTDEIALVTFAKEAGFNLVARDNDEICVEKNFCQTERFKILLVLSFTSELKRMGILLQNCSDRSVIFLCKGAEEVMRGIVEQTIWLEEETNSLASEGLRTLVFAEKHLSEKAYRAFIKDYDAASANTIATSALERERAMRGVVETHLEANMFVLGVSGVEDKLRSEVKTTFELLKQAGIKVWMLTGDKIETAVCVSKSTGIISRRTLVFSGNLELEDLRVGVLESCSQSSPREIVLVLDGADLERFLVENKEMFLEIAMKIDSVVLCRCSPTQKAAVVKLVQKQSNKRVCAVGDGGNDVGMIQVANVGIGIEGREGRSASLAADVATTEFSHISRLLLWHGRNSYLRSASIAHMVFHRGVIISIIQVVYSMILSFAVIPLFTGWMMIGYTTIFTGIPIISLVLDQDISERNIILFPQFYDYLQDRKTFSYKVFLYWLLKAIYQGTVIILLSKFLSNGSTNHLVTITFTALVFSELVNIALEIKTWNIWIAASLILSTFVYIASLFLLWDIFDKNFILSAEFLVKSLLVTCASCIPVIIFKIVQHKISPSINRKVSYGE